MLTDDSAGEQCAVRKAFGGLVDGEMEVTHLLCKVHTLRTLRTKLPVASNTKVREHLMAALYNRKPKPGYKESIQSAMQAASSHQQQYLEKRMVEYRSSLGTLRAMPFSFTSSGSINQRSGVMACLT